MQINKRIELLLLLLFNLQLVWSIHLGSPGFVVPESPELLIGSNLTMHCSIDKLYFQQKEVKQTCDVSELYFVNKPVCLGCQETKFKNQSVIINSTTISFTAYNLEEQETDYICMCSQYAISTARVRVGTKPGKVSNFECTGYDWEYMYCTFTTPKNSVITKQHVRYAVEPIDNYGYNLDCDHSILNFVSCNITGETYKKFDRDFYFHIYISSSLGNITQEIYVNNEERMILARPGQNLQVLNTTKDSICISWDNTKRSNAHSIGILWKIYVTPENFSSITRPMWRNSSAGIVDVLCLTELPYPGYKYLLELRARINKKGSRWSQPLNYNFITGPERPDRPPRVTNGSFYVYSSETQLAIYWEQLEKHELNGDNFTYVISEYRVNGTKTDTSNIAMDLGSATIRNWTKSVEHEIFIRSSNNVNTSIEASRLVIPSISDEDGHLRVPKKIRSVYHSSNSSYTLSWKAPETTVDLINYTVFWCNSQTVLISKCNGSIHFEHVPKDRLQYTRRSAHPTSLNMAVSANYVNRNTGMHWMICSSNGYNDLAKMEPIIEEITYSSLSVKWSTERVCPAILRGYNLTYCERQDGKPDNCTTKVLDSNAEDYTIHDLEPYTFYSVKMCMYSASRVSKYSDELINRTGEAAPTPPRQLEYSNVSSSSAFLTWKPPLKANGVVRTYEGTFHHDNKTEYFKLPAYTDELVDKEKFVSFELGNLTAYTIYEITIRARTLYSSEPSNVVRFRTGVGVPSMPTLNKVENTQHITTLEWLPPQLPAGRLEYYEVLIVEKDSNNSIIERESSYISQQHNLSCVMETPTCTPYFRFNYMVRAVNVEFLYAQSQMEDMELEYRWSAAKSQKCATKPTLNGTELSRIHGYLNETLYRLHKSGWAIHEVSCSPNRNSTQMLLSSFELIFAAIVIAVACHFAYKKLQKMSDIDLELPSGLKETLKKPPIEHNGCLSNDGSSHGGIICRVDNSPQYMSSQYTPQDMPHDFSSGNESSKLLLANSSGADDDHHHHQQVDTSTALPMTTTTTTTTTQLPPASYISMRQDLLHNDDDSNNLNATELHARNANPNANDAGGYIKPTQMKNWSTAEPITTSPTQMSMSPQMQMQMPLSGYVPVKMLQTHGMPVLPTVPVPVAVAPTQPQPQQQPHPHHLLSSSNYVQAADLHKLKPPTIATTGLGTGTGTAPGLVPAAAAVIAPANSFGYTSMEQLQRGTPTIMKPTSPQTLPSYTTMPVGGGVGGAGGQQTVGQTGGQQQQLQHNRLPPQIGGYVTPQDLNAIAHNRHML